MKKRKIILILVCILVSIVLIDTIQARLLKNSPILSYKERLEDDNSYVDRGFLIDTYYCTKEQDIVTVNWKFKWSKFNCPVENISIFYLEQLHNQITNIISKKDYKNVSVSYVDRENFIIVFELLENTKKEQEYFKNNIMDSKYIQFVQGHPVTSSSIYKPSNNSFLA